MKMLFSYKIVKKEYAETNTQDNSHAITRQKENKAVYIITDVKAL